MSAADAELYSSVPNRQIFFDVKIDKIEITQLKVWFILRLYGEKKRNLKSRFAQGGVFSDEQFSLLQITKLGRGMEKPCSARSLQGQRVFLIQR